MSLTIIFIIITVLVSYRAFEDRRLKSNLMMHPLSVDEFGQFYRFVTSGFVHADWNHLAINMFVLYMFGSSLENGIVIVNSEGYLEEVVSFKSIFGETMGLINFVILYIGSIIVGSIPSFIKHRNNGYYSALGASGGTSGVLFAVILFDPWSWLIFPPVPFIVFGIGYLFYSSYMSKKGTDNIGHDAHFWGGVFGFLYTVLAVYLRDPYELGKAFDRLFAGPF